MPRKKFRALDDPTIRGKKPKAKTYKLTDGDGLTVLVRPTGAKVFVLRNQSGKEGAATILGSFPEMTIAAARRAAEAARVAARAAPPEQRSGKTFNHAFQAWSPVQAADRKPAYAQDCVERLTTNVLPYLGQRSLTTIRRADVVEVLRRIMDRGSNEQARRVRALMSEVFEHAITMEWLETNPAPLAVLNVLPRGPKKKPHAAAAFEDMPTIYRRVGMYPNPVTRAAIQLLMLTAVRSGEVRGARWDEFDMDKAIWTIPAQRMKGEKPHRVPLSRQALELIDALPRISDELLFPTPRRDVVMSDNALQYALKSMFPGITIHGFRATFSTHCNNTEPPLASWDIIEAALAHSIKGVRGDYNRGDLLDARRGLMQAWADLIAS